eukprot:TRINITY_DN3626_c0_g1_i4.p1 TRINITY_DN3626_c0_g1~~TRINITY_DN3626_c0_g1_i4.p1  ORF type:complete len:164 (+),score=16.15 TRINITY_DN3626_c0_g1_i4:92-583(+)
MNKERLDFACLYDVKMNMNGMKLLHNLTRNHLGKQSFSLSWSFRRGQSYNQIRRSGIFGLINTDTHIHIHTQMMRGVGPQEFVSLENISTGAIFVANESFQNTHCTHLCPLPSFIMIFVFRFYVLLFLFVFLFVFLFLLSSSLSPSLFMEKGWQRPHKQVIWL